MRLAVFLLFLPLIAAQCTTPRIVTEPPLVVDMTLPVSISTVANASDTVDSAEWQYSPPGDSNYYTIDTVASPFYTVTWSFPTLSLALPANQPVQGMLWRARLLRCTSNARFSRVVRVCSPATGLSVPVVATSHASGRYALTGAPVALVVNMSATSPPVTSFTWQRAPAGTWNNVSPLDSQFSLVTQGVGSPGAASTSLSFAGDSSVDGHRFRLVSTNCAGTTTTAEVKFCSATTGSAAPAYTQALSPSMIAFSAGTPTSISAAVTAPVASVVWNCRAPGGNWGTCAATTYTVSGSLTSSTLSWTQTASNAGWSYRVLFANCANCASGCPLATWSNTATVCTSATGLVEPTFSVPAADPPVANVLSGATVTFRVTSSTPVASLQWQVLRPGQSWSTSVSGTVTTDLPTGTSTLSFTSSASVNGYQFRVLATNCAGTGLSRVFSLCAGALPTVGVHPTRNGDGRTPSLYLFTGQQGLFASRPNVGVPAVTLSAWEVQAGGVGPWSPAPGASWNATDLFNAQLALTGAPALHGNVYRVRYINCVGDVVSNTAFVCAGDAPVVVTHPAPVARVSGASVVFTALASSAVVPPVTSVVWEYSNNGGVNWGVVSSSTPAGAVANSTTLTFPSSASYHGWLFRSRFVSCLTSTASNAASLCAGTPDTVRTNPTAVNVRAGGVAVFIAATNGAVPAVSSFEWELSANNGASWSVVPNDNVTYAYAGTPRSPQLSVLATTGALDQTLYRVRVTNCLGDPEGSVRSAPARLCTGDSPVVVGHPASINVVANAQSSFAASAVGSVPAVVTSFWQWSTVAPYTSWATFGASSGRSFGGTVAAPSFNVTPTPDSWNGYRFRAVFRNCFNGETMSDVAVLCVAALPTVTANPQFSTRPTGTQVTYTATGTTNTRYGVTLLPSVWERSTDGGVTWASVAGIAEFSVAGTSPTTLTFTSAAQHSGHLFRALLTNCAGATPTAAALFTLCTGAVPVVTLQPVAGVSVRRTNLVTWVASATSSPGGPDITAVVWQYERPADPGVWVDVVPSSTFVVVTTGMPGTVNVTSTLTTRVDSPQNQYRWRASFVNCMGSTSTAPSLLCTGDITFLPDLPSVTVNDFTPVPTMVATVRTPTVPTLLTVQWMRSTDGRVSWQPISVPGTAPYTGTTSLAGGSLDFLARRSMDRTWFRMEFTSCLGVHRTRDAELRVSCSGALPTVTAHPAAVSVPAAGAVATFTAAANSVPFAHTVVWQVSADGGQNWVNVVSGTQGYTVTSTVPSAADSSTQLDIVTSLSQDVFQYRAVFTNCLGARESNVALLSVACTGICPPAVLVHPRSVLVPSGVVAAFDSQTSGSSISASSWDVSFDSGTTWGDALALVPGANATGLGTSSLTLRLIGTLPLSGAYFRANFTNAQGTRTTRVAVLSVFDSTTSCTDYGCNGLSREASCNLPEDCGSLGFTDCGCKCSACPTCVGSANPVFSKQCSANIILILDESGSISSSLNAVRSGVTQFLLSFAQTRTIGGTATLGTMEFDDTARLVTVGGNQGRMVELTPAWVTAMTTYINNNGPSSSDTTGYRPGGCTNWGAAMKTAYETPWKTQVSGLWVNTQPDVILLFTDGAPTVHDGTCNRMCNFGRRRATTGAFVGLCRGYSVGVTCYWADQIKARGIKIFLVGVGGVTSTIPTVQLVTGPRAWNQQADTWANSDYVVTQDYSSLGIMFLNVIKSLCQCYQNAPACSNIGASCFASQFSARIRVTTTTTTSTTFPPNSVTAATIYYYYVPTPNTRVGYEFFASTQTVNTPIPTVVRTDIQDPCKIQRVVSCSNRCLTVSERQDIPRFFREASDVAGAPGGTWMAPPECMGWTKVYPNTSFAVVSQAMTRFLWTLPDSVTPCAAQLFDGTFVEFFGAAGTAQRGVIGLAQQPQRQLPYSGPPQLFNFAQTSNCTTPQCSRDVEVVFLVDESADVAAADFAAIKSFITAVVESFTLESPATQFGIVWSNPQSDTTFPDPLVLTATSRTAPNFQSTIVAAHVQLKHPETDFAARATYAINKYWPTTRVLTSAKRQLITIVAQGTEDAPTAASSRFDTLRALAQARSVEQWTVGLGAGASQPTLLRDMSTNTDTFSHYFSYVENTFLLDQAPALAGLFCPQGNLCGAGCGGFCECAEPASCRCPVCTSTDCYTRSCPDPAVGCLGPQRVCDTKGSICISDACTEPGGCLFTPILNCDDGNACTVDLCGAGGAGTGCSHVPVSCDDSNPCTVDSCNSTTGACRSVPVVCDDGNNCTTDTCDVNGVCRYAPVVCTDGNACTTDTCDGPAGGVCRFVPVICNDGFNCTTDRCASGGACEYTPINCDDSNPCTVDSCDEAAGGVCRSVPVVCDDGNNCTTDTCDANGVCRYAPVVCTDGNACTTDTCDGPAGGVCRFVPVICNDGFNCTTDRCTSSGACEFTPINCADSDPCTVDSCDEAAGGVCRSVPVVCDDGLPCTVDKCSGGQCTYTDVQCSDGNPCTDDSCNPTTGACINSPKVCFDGLPCTQDACVGGTCVFSPVNCADADPCTLDTCDALSGQCVHTNFTCLTACGYCDDSDPCTIDSCNGTSLLCVFTPKDCGSSRCFPSACDATSGACVTQSLDCNDGDPCTVDTCDEQAGCVHTPKACGVNNACEQNVCVNGECRQTFTPCASSDACFTSACNVGSGGCVLTPKPCPSNTLCESWACVGGQCVATPQACDDGNACTVDTCSNATGCVHTPVDCGASDECVTRRCNAQGQCETITRVCDDNNACTVDSCNSSTGCANVPVVCPPSTPCVISQCVGGTCRFTDVVCDDGDPCTQDSCRVSAGGCVFEPIVCLAASPCVHSECRGGVCVNDNVLCNDGDPCTVDSCDPLRGCVFTNVSCPSTPCATNSCVNGACIPQPITCNDGNPCTLDRCVDSAGGCQYVPVRCDQSVSDCFVVECVGDDGLGGPLCNTTTPISCDDSNSCTTDKCEQGRGCVHVPILCLPTTDCNYPVGCIGNTSVPQCVYQDIQAFIDFCGQCNGDNAACFFSSVLPTSTIAGIAAGTAVGIAVACVAGIAIAVVLSKKGYDYYRAQSDMNAAGLHSNPYYTQNELAGAMPSTTSRGV